MLVLVVYDIACDRLRRRLARLLAGYGERVQRSAFECRLRRRERRELEQRLRALVEAAPGPPRPEGELPEGALPACSVRLYPLPASARATELGAGLDPAPQETVIV